MKLKSGSPSRARTYDLRINSPSLYRLSYRGSGRKAGFYRMTVAMASATYSTFLVVSAATQMRPVSMV